jgi:hypothetical protein
MFHVRNSSLGGIFFLENDGVPVAVVTQFSEPIVDGSLCVDRVNENLYILRDQVWELLGGASTSSVINNNVIASNYNSIINASTSGTLLTGTLYSFQYQNIHLIPGTNVLNIDSPDYVLKQETFLATATSPTTIDKKVFSVQHPTDEIEFDIFDNVAEDGSSGRTGKVYRRIDTVLRRDTPYDHRATYFRRTNLDTSSYTNYSTSGGATEYNIAYNEGTNFYRQEDQILYTTLREIVEKENFEFNQFLSKKTFPNYKKFASYTDFDNTLPFDASMNEDVLTFESNETTDIYIESSKDFGLNNHYNDVVFYGTCSNIKLSGFVRSSTFDNSSNVELQKDAFGMIISDSNNIIGETTLNTILLNSNNINLIIKYDKTIQIDNRTYINNSTNVDIGKNAVGNCIIYSSNVDIRDESKGNVSTVCKNVSIKKECFNNYFESIDTIHLSDKCINGRILSDLYYLVGIYGDGAWNGLYGNLYGCTDLEHFCSHDIRLDSGCEDITVYEYAKKLRLGKYCKMVSIQRCDDLTIGDNLTKAYISRGEKSIIGEGCSRIFVQIFESTIENYCNEIEESFIYNSTIKKGTSILSRSTVHGSTINNTGINNGIFNCLISGSKIEHTFDKVLPGGANRYTNYYDTAGAVLPVYTETYGLDILPRKYAMVDTQIMDSVVINCTLTSNSNDISDVTDIQPYLTSNTIMDTKLRIQGNYMEGTRLNIKSSNIQSVDIVGSIDNIDYTFTTPPDPDLTANGLGMILYRVNIPKAIYRSSLILYRSILHDVTFLNSVNHSYRRTSVQHVVFDSNVAPDPSSPGTPGQFDEHMTYYNNCYIDSANIKVMRSQGKAVYEKSFITKSIIYLGGFENMEAHDEFNASTCGTAGTSFCDIATPANYNVSMDIRDSLIHCHTFKIKKLNKKILFRNSNIVNADTVILNGDVKECTFSNFMKLLTVESDVSNLNIVSGEDEIIVGGESNSTKIDFKDPVSGTNFRQTFVDNSGFLKTFTTEYRELTHNVGVAVDYDLLNQPMQNVKILTDNSANFRINLTNPFPSGDYNVMVEAGVGNLAVEIYDNDNATLIDTLTIVNNGAKGIFNIRYIDSSIGYLVKLTEY